jgi:hypothetical protein
VAAACRIRLFIDERVVATTTVNASCALDTVGWSSQGVGWYLRERSANDANYHFPDSSYSTKWWPGGIADAERLYFFEGAQVPCAVNFARSCGPHGTGGCNAAATSSSSATNAIGFAGDSAAVTDGATMANFSTAYTYYEGDVASDAALTIDLEKVRSVASVRVWQRSDCCFSDQYRLRVGNDTDFANMVKCKRQDGTVAGNIDSAGADPWYTHLECNMAFRYVTIKPVDSSSMKLSLAEVEVWSVRCEAGARPVDGTCVLCEKGKFLHDDATHCVSCPGYVLLQYRTVGPLMRFRASCLTAAPLQECHDCRGRIDFASRLLL